MIAHRNSVLLPSGYDENALFLLVQSPKVLYAYWELSPGLKEALKEALSEEKKVQIRLNIEGRGPFYAGEISLSERNFYFSEVEPGFSYNCEIGISRSGGDFYPLLRSNPVTAPIDRPLEGSAVKDPYSFLSIFNESSWTLYQEKK